MPQETFLQPVTYHPHTPGRAIYNDREQFFFTMSDDGELIPICPVSKPGSNAAGSLLFKRYLSSSSSDEESSLGSSTTRCGSPIDKLGITSQKLLPESSRGFSSKTWSSPTRVSGLDLPEPVVVPSENYSLPTRVSGMDLPEPVVVPSENYSLRTRTSGVDLPEAVVSPSENHSSPPLSPGMNLPESVVVPTKSYSPPAQIPGINLPEPVLGLSISRLTKSSLTRPSMNAIQKRQNNFSASSKLSIIHEEEEFIKNYKVQPRNKFIVESDPNALRSPVKKLFGEKGLLGLTTDIKELPDPRYRKKGVDKWGQKLQRVASDMSVKVSARVAALDRSKRTPPRKNEPRKIPTSVAPFSQGLLYFKLELLLQSETHIFLTDEFAKGHISADSVKEISTQWRNKGRGEVIGFRWDLLTQRELIMRNLDTIRFSGIARASVNHRNSILDAWKSLAKDFTLHTYCQPNSAIKKHLFDAQRVLSMIHPRGKTVEEFDEAKDGVLREMEEALVKGTDMAQRHSAKQFWSPEQLSTPSEKGFEVEDKLFA